MKENKFDQQHMAILIGVSRNAIGKWLDGSRFPRCQYWQAISDGTGGKVTIYDFVAAEEDRQKARKDQAVQD